MIGNERRDSFLGRLYHISQDSGHDNAFLGAFEKLRKRLLASCQAIRPSAWNKSASNRYIFVELCIGNVY
jgi:hypothetical protein